MNSICNRRAFYFWHFFWHPALPNLRKRFRRRSKRTENFSQGLLQLSWTGCNGGHTKAPRLIDVEFLEENFSNDEIRDTVVNGINKMPPQRNKVSDEEIGEVIKYLRFSQNDAGLAAEDDSEEEEGESFEEPPAKKAS